MEITWTIGRKRAKAWFYAWKTDAADAAAWSAFLAFYRPVVYRLARSRGLQDADADDLAQQFFVSIARAVENWTPTADGPPFRAWLYRIAHNEILKAITRRKPGSAAGSSSVQEMLHTVPQHDSDASVELLREGRMEAFHGRNMDHVLAVDRWITIGQGHREVSRSK
jgi:RNA polymerase sigma-70 factor, ECF subfamily